MFTEADTMLSTLESPSHDSILEFTPTSYLPPSSLMMETKDLDELEKQISKLSWRFETTVSRLQERQDSTPSTDDPAISPPIAIPLTGSNGPSSHAPKPPGTLTIPRSDLEMVDPPQILAFAPSPPTLIAQARRVQRGQHRRRRTVKFEIPRIIVTVAPPAPHPDMLQYAAPLDSTEPTTLPSSSSLLTSPLPHWCSGPLLRPPNPDLIYSHRVHDILKEAEARIPSTEQIPEETYDIEDRTRFHHFRTLRQFRYHNRVLKILEESEQWTSLDNGRLRDGLGDGYRWSSHYCEKVEIVKVKRESNQPTTRKRRNSLKRVKDFVKRKLVDGSARLNASSDSSTPSVKLTPFPSPLANFPRNAL